MTSPRQLWSAYRNWPWAARAATYVAIGLCMVLIAGLATGVVLVRRAFPQTTGTLTISGLDGSVEVIRDDYGIPQLYADSSHDLFLAQGFVHAQDRFFEMDVRRHLTAGRLSEMFGEAGLETDKMIRTMGWRRVAQQELALTTPETRAALKAYAEGVNAFLSGRRLSEISLEYVVLDAGGLDYQPEKWTAVDTLAWLKAMAWDLSGNIREESGRVLAGVNHTEEQVDELYPAFPFGEHDPIVDGGRVVDGRFQAESADATNPPARPAYSPLMVRALSGAQDGLDAIPALLGKGSGIGSNSWVVDGDHSATGQPLLANDPHLGVSLPGIWSQMGLHCRTVSDECPYDVSGFSFSGVPGIVIGHNADISWGFTNLGPDVMDLYLEKVQGDRWLREGRYRDLDVRTETIKVADGDDFTLKIRESKHGPLISDVSDEYSSVGANAELSERTARPGRPAAEGTPPRGSGYAVALQWTALQPSTTANAIVGLNTASNWREFRAAARDFQVPAQNLIYADRRGHIGYQAPGRVPIRNAGNDGRLPAAGWLRSNDWSGRYVPFQAMPSVLDPDEGFIVTANQAVVDPSYPYRLTDDWDYGYRSQRIRDRIEDEGDLSIDEMGELQLDSYSALAETLVPYLLDVRVGGRYWRGGIELLKNWDFTQDADSAPAAYFNVVWRNLLSLTFHDELRESLWPDGGSRWWLVVSRMLDQPGHPMWDDRRTDQVETRDDILKQALLDARDEMVQRQARRPDQWSWGHLHRLNLHSPTLGESGIGAIEWLFNSDGWEVGGGSSAVDASAWDAAEGYQVTSAPSMRMVVSLRDFDESRWINLTGASGHSFHPHLTDQTELYVEGRTLPWAFSREAVTAAGEDTLTLKPGD